MQAGQVVAILAAMGGIGLAQTPPAANPGRSSSSAIENEYIRVVNVKQAPHQKTRPHQHTMNRIMLYLTAGSQVNEYEGGRKEVLNFKAGQPLWSAAGGVHVAEGTSEQPITIAEMELSKPSGRNPATTLDPLKVDPKHYKLEFENGQVRVFRVKIGPHEKVPLHEHVLNRVVVYLTGQRDHHPVEHMLMQRNLLVRPDFDAKNTHLAVLKFELVVLGVDLQGIERGGGI